MSQPQAPATILSNQQSENLTLARVMMARVVAFSSRPASAKNHGARLAAAQQAARKRALYPGAPTTCSFGGTGFHGRSLSVSPR
jgi:hypothetical protein